MTPALSASREAFLASADAATTLAERSAQVDRIVLDAAAGLLETAPEGLTLVAVGGYGRRHLFPCSDVDLLLLCANERVLGGFGEPVAAFLQKLWDAGLRVSQSVRTLTECLEIHEQNIELNISLLDQRYLGGDRSLYGALSSGLARFWRANCDLLVRHLARLTHDRHSKAGNTLYHLEPNVKETPGGLRDYQTIGWLDRLRDAGPGYAAVAEGEELQQAFRFLSRVRCYLHFLWRRDANQLSFPAQEAIADEWWPGIEGSGAVAGEGRAAEWMRQYYRHARVIYRAATRALDAAESQSNNLLAQFRDWRSRVSNADFSVHRDHVHFRAPQQLNGDPRLAIGLFEFVARHGIPPSLEAEQQIEMRLAHFRKLLRQSQPLWPAVEAVLALPNAPAAVRAMHETGFLTALFPELADIDGLVIRNFYHRYTVDEHTLVAMQNLADLQEAPAGGNGYADLLSEVKRPALLFLALLFHDSGKAFSGTNHVADSLRLVDRAMDRIQVPNNDIETVRFLIRGHLDLSSALQARDVFDPATIRELAIRVETVERLKALTLLTWADIGAVNPEAMTPWRAQQLWQLYLMLYNELTRELESERIERVADGEPERMAFLEGFPTRYLRTHSEKEIDADVELERRSHKRGLALEIRRMEAAWQLTLVTRDRPRLFADVAGTLSSFGVNILKAEAFANRQGVVLDTFTFADPNRTLDLNPSEVERLSTVMERVLAGKTNVRELLRHRPQPKLPSRKAAIRPRVSFNSEASQSATLVEIVAQDRPGLLYDLASAICTCGGNIEVVLIDTEAHKAIDVFYVTANSGKLDAETQKKMSEALGRVCPAG